MSFAVTRGRITSHDVNQSKRDKSATELSSKPLKASTLGPQLLATRTLSTRLKLCFHLPAAHNR